MQMRSTGLIFIVVGLCALATISCGEGGMFSAETATPELAVFTPTVVALPPDASTAARIRAQGYLLVGVRFDDEPFGIVDDVGDLVGFDVDLAREFARRWLGDPNAVQFVQVTNASVTDRIANDQVNLVIGALTPHQSDAKVLDYSVPYYYDGLSLAVRVSSSITNTTIIASPRDLGGVPVGIVDESDTESLLLSAAQGAVPMTINYPNYYAAMAGLENGVLGAVVGPRRTLERLTLGSTEVGVLPRFTRNSYAIGVPKNEGSLLDLVNVTLMDVVNDGTYDQLYRKWFPGAERPNLENWMGTSRYAFDSLGDTLTSSPVTIQDIETRGYLVVAAVDNMLPFSDFDANGVAQGFEADLARTLAGRWLDNVTAIQFSAYTEEAGVAALQSGQVDLLIGRIPHTMRREDEIDFSQAIYEDGIGLLVGAESGVSGLNGLNGAAVAVTTGNNAADVIQKAALESGVVVSIQPVGDVNEALAGVADGRYAAFADWRSDLLNLAYTYSGFLVLDDRLTSRPLAMGLRQGDGAFRDLLNLSLQALAAEGTYAAIYDDWFGTDPPLSLEVWPGVPYRPLKIRRSPTPAP
jgi:ABC-type amino acid transport substrate-binding protein